MNRSVRLRLTCMAATVGPAHAWAHVAVAAEPAPSVWSSVDPWSALLLLGMACCYARGTRLLARRSRARQRLPPHGALLFWSGLATLAVALGPPLDPLGGLLFSAHMLQHEILMLVSAPLLVLSRPSGRLLWGLPQPGRRLCAYCSRRTWLRHALRRLTAPLGAWTVHAAALWIWHLPALFDASLRSDAVHAAQHGSFFVSALLFWWALLASRSRARSGGAILYVFTTALHSSVLGALLTFAPAVWYASYAATTLRFGLSALEDQQLGGLIMWVPSGLVFLVAALVLLARWLQPERPTERFVYGRDAGGADD